MADGASCRTGNWCRPVPRGISSRRPPGRLPGSLGDCVRTDRQVGVLGIALEHDRRLGVRPALRWPGLFTGDVIPACPLVPHPCEVGILAASATLRIFASRLLWQRLPLPCGVGEADERWGVNTPNHCRIMARGRTMGSVYSIQAARGSDGCCRPRREVAVSNPLETAASLQRAEAPPRAAALSVCRTASYDTP